MKRFAILVFLLGASFGAAQSIEPASGRIAGARLELASGELGVSRLEPASRILTYKQYARVKHDVPYVLEFKAGKGALLVFGSRHVYDPSAPDIEAIVRAWDEFKPDVAYNEGGDPPVRSTLKLAVERHGECGLVRFLAARDVTPIATFEPSFADQIRALRKRYSPEQIVVWDTLRAFLTFRSSKHDETAEAFIADQLDNPVWQTTGLGDTAKITSVAEFQAACKKLFVGLKDWRKVPEDWFDPTQEGRYTNDMENENGMLRNQHIFKVLTRRAQRGDRVFAVMGASHVPVLEPALVAAFGSPVRKIDGLRPTPR